MRALLAFTGSRGDAQPGILLARELAARGHGVTLALSPNLVGLATRHGIASVGFGCDSSELLRIQHDDRRSHSPNPWRRFQAILELQRRGVPRAIEDLIRLAPGHDIMVTGMAGEEAADAAARRHRLPLAAMHLFPIHPSRSVPVVAADWGSRIPPVPNRWIWRGLRWARAAALRSVLAPYSAYPPVPQQILLQAFDIELFPGLRTELPQRHPVTGFPVECADPRAVSRDDELEAWLAAGDAPVYAGFGSMSVDDPAALVSLLRQVCARRGHRLLLAAGWAGLTTGYSAEVAVVDQVDHAAVLPRCLAAVHHGGAGTTAAALRAGVPQIICSIQADQPYWGQVLHRHGLGATLPARDLTARRLTALLDLVGDPDLIARAHAYASTFDDAGVRRAVDHIELLARSAGPSPVHPPLPVGKPL